MQITKAVILAAGLGTRFLPYTKAYPKEMIAVVDKPALQLIVEEVVDSGINDILIIINHSKEEIIKHFSTDLELEKFLLDKGKTKELAIVRAISTLAHITYAYQEIPNGTGGAIALAESFANKEPILVLNGDDAMYNFDTPVSRQIMDAYAHCNTSVLGVQEVSREAISKYASCHIVKSFGRLHLIDSVIEKPKTDEQIASLLAPLGRYALSSDFFTYLARTPVSASGELVMTDALLLQARDKGIYAYDFEGIRYDLGDKLGYLKAVVEYALRDKTLGSDFNEYLTDLVIGRTN